MKNKIKKSGFAAMVAAIGLSMAALSLAGCDTGTSGSDNSSSDSGPGGGGTGGGTGGRHGGSSIYAIAYGDGKFVAGGSYYYINYTPYYSYRYDKMAYSSDGITWTAVPNSIFDGIWNSVMAIAYGNGKFVAGIYDLHTDTNREYSYSGKIATSPDGVTWTPIADSIFGTPDNSITAIVYDNGKFVAGGIGKDSGGSINGRIAYSSDGTTWTVAPDSMFRLGSNAIAYGNGKFVVGSDTDEMAYSSDGMNWTDAPTLTFSIIIHAIAYGNGKFVAVGEKGKMAYSTDGINWTEVTDSKFGTSDIFAIAYDNGKFVAGGDNGKMAYSTDGVTWTAVANSTFGTSDSDSVRTIAYGSNGGSVNRFVAGSDNGKMAYSSDGITWTAVANSPF